MKIQILVDFDRFWASLARDVLAANNRVFVQTFSFEGDRVGQMLRDLLNRSRAPDKRILVDSFSRIVLSDRFLYAPANWFSVELRQEATETRRLHRDLRSAGVDIKYGNPFGISPRKLLRRNHKKLIVIDDRVAYIGGINFSEHNAAWHDMMLRIESLPVAGFLRDDFNASWRGENCGAAKCFGAIEINTLDGHSNKAAFEKVLALIDDAQESIFIASPYITFPFYDRLRDARRRRVQVKIITPKENNWGHFTDYARWESSRCGIDLRLLKAGMSHLKAMLIDDRHLIAGSSNFDFLSYRVYEEIVAIITDPQVIADFRGQVLEVDLRNADYVEEHGTTSSSAWYRLRARLLNAGLTMLFE